MPNSWQKFRHKLEPPFTIVSIIILKDSRGRQRARGCISRESEIVGKIKDEREEKKIQEIYVLAGGDKEIVYNRKNSGITRILV